MRRDYKPDSFIPPADIGIWGEIARLPERQREALVLKYVSDLPEAQIALVMGVSRGSVASTLAGARNRLRYLRGTGKSRLLIGLGTAAAEAGYRVRYELATKLVNELVEAADERVLTKTIARYGRVDLLCVDELEEQTRQRATQDVKRLLGIEVEIDHCPDRQPAQRRSPADQTEWNCIWFNIPPRQRNVAIVGILLPHVRRRGDRAQAVGADAPQAESPSSPPAGDRVVLALQLPSNPPTRRSRVRSGYWTLSAKSSMTNDVWSVESSCPSR